MPARDLLARSHDEFCGAFGRSPMKRAKLRGRERNAAVALGNVGTGADVGMLTRVRDKEREALLRAHAV